MIHYECNNMDPLQPILFWLDKEDSKRLNLKWEMDWKCGHEFTRYYYQKPDQYVMFCHRGLKPSTLRFLIQNFRKHDHDQHAHMHPLRNSNYKNKVFSATCDFIDRLNVHVRILLSAPNGHCYSCAQVYFFDKPGGKMIGQMEFFIYVGSAPSWMKGGWGVIESMMSTEEDAVIEVLSCKFHKAVHHIQCSYLRAKYNPSYDLCKRLLLRDLEFPLRP